MDQVVIVGLDGMAPELAEKFMAEGKLPNLAKLKAEGVLRPAADDDSGHLARSLVIVHDRGQSLQAQHLRLPEPRPQDLSARPFLGPHRQRRSGRSSSGRYRVPLSKPVIQGLRKSVPFWKILGENGVF